MTTMPKTVCPVTLEQFKAAAPQLMLSMGRDDLAGDAAFYVAPKQFSTGSVGLHGQAKITINVGGIAMPVQVGALLTVIGSKEADSAAKGALLNQLAPVMVKVHVGRDGKPPVDPSPEKGGTFPAAIKAPFSTGSFGWNTSAKLTSGDATLQIGINLTAVGSKPAAK